VPRLVAYLVRSGEVKALTADVHSALEQQLPSNMVPKYIVWLDALPLTPNGKLDRKALPAPIWEETKLSEDHPHVLNSNVRSPKSGKRYCRYLRSACDRTFSISEAILLLSSAFR